MREICITPNFILKWKKWKHRKVFNPRSQSRLGLKTNLEPRSEHGLLGQSKNTPQFLKYITGLPTHDDLFPEMVFLIHVALQS